MIVKKKYAREKKFRGLALKDLSRDDANGDCVRRTLPRTLPLLVNGSESDNPVMVNLSQIGKTEVYLDATFPLLRILAEEREQSNPCNKASGNFNTYFQSKLQLLLLLFIVKL